MKKLLLIAGLLFSSGFISTAVAQTAPMTMINLGYELDPTLENEGVWSKNGDNSVAILLPSTMYGYKQLLDIWSKLKVQLDEKYGEGERVRSDVQACSYCGSATDYANWHTSIQVGSAWIDIADDYNSIRSRLILTATSKAYFILLVNGTEAEDKATEK
jgi:hypothetical protein